MTNSARSIAHSANSAATRAAAKGCRRCRFCGDRRARRLPSQNGSAGAYDGTWNVIFATQAGNCSATNSVPFVGSGRRVSSAGGGKVTGGISRAGVVSVNIQVGASHASGSGRLVGNSGSRPLERHHHRRRCSGSWQATRT